MAADGFTKLLPKGKQSQFLDQLGLVDIKGQIARIREKTVSQADEAP
jgi:hypothetical protein